MSTKILEFILVMLIACLLLIISLMLNFIWHSSESSELRRECLSHGYPDSELSNGEGFCIDRNARYNNVINVEDLK